MMVLPPAVAMAMLRLRRICHPQHDRQRKHTQKDSFHIVPLLSGELA
jgi:hypothetical protein